ncbi:MAG: hypothetical protein JWM57_2165 [Phycisphaerales bacterium]|nr:hypothetical protein [Phycisphaerales bacterium]
MKRRRTVTILILGLCFTGGCRRGTAAPAPAPATQVAASQPATQPADAPPATMIINGQAFIFPAPKLVAIVKDGALRVTLFSNDPAEAVREGYTGNSFYFRFNMDGEKPDDLSGQQYLFRNSYAEQDETASGLFIAGGRQTLRPMDATISFDPAGGQLTVVHITGSFKLIDDQTPDNQTTIVKVQAMLEIPVAQPAH